MRFRSKLFAFLIFLVVLGVLVLGTRKQETVRETQSWFLSFLTPFLQVAAKFKGKVDSTVTDLKTLEQLESECQTLRTLNRELSATNQVFRDLEADNQRLRKALGYRERSVFKLMPARIIGRDVSTWFNQVVIDRGSEDGVKKDMSVLTEDGLVGKTTVVSEHSAIVILISDENCKAAASVENSREQGIVRGERASSGSMPLVSLYCLSKQAGLKPGQKVVTSGVGGVFPAGVSLGTVQEFRVRELDGYATLVPSVDLTTLQDVFVVVSQQK